MKYSGEGDQEFYNDGELDIGYESEAMFIEPEEYVRFPLPKGKDARESLRIRWCVEESHLPSSHYIVETCLSYIVGERGYIWDSVVWWKEGSAG